MCRMRIGLDPHVRAYRIFGGKLLGILLLCCSWGRVLLNSASTSSRRFPSPAPYLPGKANIHFVFWACLMYFIRLLKEGAHFKSHMLNKLLSCILMLFWRPVSGSLPKFLSTGNKT